MTTLKTIAVSVGKVVAGCVVLVLLLEVALRPFGYGSHTLYEPDQRLLWVPVANQASLTVVNHEPLSISADRFRYATRLTTKAADEIRIFAFGDSVTMGWGVNDGAHYSAVLEHLLRQEAALGSARVRVVSAGVNAYPNSLVLERFRAVVEDGYQPDIAIIAYSFNRGFESVAELEGSQREQLMRNVRLKGLLTRSAFYSFTVEGILRNTVYYAIRDRLVAGSWESKDSVGPASDSTIGAAGYKAKLQAMRAFADQHGVRPVLLLLGSNGQKAHAHPLQAAMREFAADSSVAIVDMIEAFKTTNHEQMFMDHVHPSVEGHALIARHLLPVVRAAALNARGAAGRQASAGKDASIR